MGELGVEVRHTVLPSGGGGGGGGGRENDIGRGGVREGRGRARGKKERKEREY